MATLVIIKKSLLDMKDRNGSSLIKIKKWVATNEKKEIKKHVMSAALKKGVTDGSLIKIKASYKLAPDAKKAMTAKPKKAAPKKKKAAPKKTTTKKKAVKKSTKKKTTKKKITVKAKASTKKSTKKSPAKKKTATKKKAAVKKTATKKK